MGALSTAFSAGVDVGQLEGEGIAAPKFPLNTTGRAAVTATACGLLAMTSLTGRREDFKGNSKPES